MSTQTETMSDEREEMDARGCLLPEAGGVAYADLWSPEGFKVCITARGANAMEALDDLITTTRYGMVTYQLSPAPVQAMAQRAQQTAPKPAQETGVPSGPPEPPEPPAPPELTTTPPAKANGAPVTRVAAPAPSAPAGVADGRGNVPGQRDVEELAAIEITPVAGGKVKLAFFPRLGNGSTGRYASLYETISMDKWSAALGVDEGTDLISPPEPLVAQRFEFQPGVWFMYEVSPNQSSKGNYYLNYRGVTTVQP